MKKNIYKNAFYNMLYKLLSVIFPLITATYVARVLLPEGIGKVTYAQTIVTYFLMFATLGIPNYGIREMAKASNLNERSRSFTEIFTISTVSTLFTIVLFYVLVSSTSLFFRDKELYYVTGLLLVFNFINVDWVYQGTENYRYIAIRSLIVKIVFTISLFVFVKTKEDYILYSLLYCLANGVNYLFNIFSLKKYVQIKKTYFNINNIKQHIIPILVLFSATISNEIYLHLDITMIGAICGDEFVGYYTNSSKLMHVISNALIAIGAVILPRLSFYIKNNQIDEAKKTISQFTQILLWISIPSAIGLFAISDQLIPVLFGNMYLPSITTLKIHSFLVFEFAIEGGILCPVLIATKRENKYSIATFIGALSNIVINFFLIHLWQHNGAALASAISKTIIILIELYYTRSYFDNKSIANESKKVVVATAIMFVAILCSKSLLASLTTLVSLAIEIIIGVLIYGIVLIILKDTILLMVLGKIRTTIKR